MQQIDNLKDIFSAMQEIGAAWQGEVVKLREENARLTAENAELKKNFLALKNDINNLSEKAGQLAINISDAIKNLRDEIIKELNVKYREEFQKFVADKFDKLLAKCDKPAENYSSETPAYNTGKVGNNVYDD